jgi:GTP-binding protein EngB required for normal cell division
LSFPGSTLEGGEHVEQAFAGTGNHEVSSLRTYTLAKQEVTASVRSAKQLFQTLSAQEAVERCQELLVQLAEDRFNLAVVGQFKRGKSTLMNAIIGRDLLPTGLLPLTSAITTLCYGPQERLMLRRKGWGWEQEAPLAQLADFITERGNPGNEKGLIEARVELPVPFLRRGLYFIDTPGIGSVRHENTATTYAFLPQMAAVIFVTSVEAPLSEAEERFLLDIRGQVRQLFIVVNKLDMLADSEREEVLDYIRMQIKRLLGTADIPLYPLSARSGLTAKLHHDETGVSQNGLASFEQALTTFLAEQQGRTFLVSILDRALHLFAAAEQTLARTSTESELQGKMLELRASLESLREALLAGGPLSAALRPIEPEGADAHVIEQVIAVGRSPVRKAGGRLARAGTCPICTALGKALFAFFAQWQYTLATDPTAQRAFAIERGLCPIHTWQYQEMASPQGISDGYAPLIETLAAELSRLSEHPDEHVAEALAVLLSSPARCAACRLVRETTAEQVELLLTHLLAQEGRADYTSSAGLCLPHLQAAVARVEDSNEESSERRTVLTFLLREQERRLEDLADDLHSYTLKRDALRRGLLNQEEADAWRRALVQVVGERAARGGALMGDQATI